MNPNGHRCHVVALWGVAAKTADGIEDCIYDPARGQLAGFAILTAILAGLASYLVLNLFYLFSTTWLQPAIVSPTDEKILHLSAQIAARAPLGTQGFYYDNQTQRHTT